LTTPEEFGMSYGLPPPPGPPSADARNWALMAHLTALALFIGVPPFVGPLVVWLLRRDSEPFVDAHGREALNFNLSLLVYGVIGFVVALVTLGVGLIVIAPIGLVLGILWLIWTIQAGLAASRGEAYRYPITIRFVR
jgi:uncharacterized protein